MKKINGGSETTAAVAAQTRVSRYKEERRKQLANQFANLVTLPRNYDYDGTSSAALTSSDASRKTAAFKSHNLIVVQGKTAKLDNDNDKLYARIRYVWVVNYACIVVVHTIYRADRFLNAASLTSRPMRNGK